MPEWSTKVEEVVSVDVRGWQGGDGLQFSYQPTAAVGMSNGQKQINGRASGEIFRLDNRFYRDMIDRGKISRRRWFGLRRHELHQR
jgi:hypothetical protein